MQKFQSNFHLKRFLINEREFWTQITHKRESFAFQFLTDLKFNLAGAFPEENIIFLNANFSNEREKLFYFKVG